jgi:hypothetical protein
MNQPSFRTVFQCFAICLIANLIVPCSLQAQPGGVTLEEVEAAEQDHPYIHVLEPSSSDRAWQKAVRMLKGQQFYYKHEYTLLRVLQDKPTPQQPVMLGGIKLVELTPKYTAGGGSYFHAKSGDFLLIEHINGSRRRKVGENLYQDPITVGHPDSGTLVVWVDVPKRGELQGREIVFKPCPKSQYGQLQVALRKRSSVLCDQFMLGVVSFNDIEDGPFPINPKKRKGPILLAPGDYKIFFAQIDPAKARFDFKILSKQTTFLSFSATNQKTIVQVTEQPKDDLANTQQQ